MNDSTQPKKPLHKRKLVWVGLGLLLLIIIVSSSNGSKTTTSPAHTDASTPATSTGATTTEQPKYDPQAAYDKILAGQSRSEAETLIGIQPSNCSESTIAGYGTTTYCTYMKGFSSTSIGVTYHDNVVESKTINKF